METSASRHGHFTPGERASGIRWISVSVGLKAGMDAVKKIPYPCIPRLSSSQPSVYNDRAMRAQLIYIYIHTHTHTHTQGVHCAGLLDVQNISRQTDGHSFGDHLISDSVRVTPTSVTEASIVLCVFMTRVSQCPISLRSEPI
jgi:hypothetical protein